MILTPKNWASFQHYKERAPAWIKLHKGLLDDYEFSCLPVASKALAPCLWLLASEYPEGKIDASLDKIAFRLRMTRGELADALNPLVERGFFDASELLADCKQDAIPEKEREIEEEKEKREIAVASASDAFASNDPSIAERDFFRRGREVLGKSAGGQLAKLKASRGHNIALARAVIEAASQKENPAEYVAAVIRGPPAVRATTVHQQRHQEGREILDDLDKFISGASCQTDSRFLRFDSGNGSAGVHGGVGGDFIDVPACRDRARG